MRFFKKISTKMALMAIIIICAGFTVTTWVTQQHVSRAFIERELSSKQVISKFLAQSISPSVKFRKADRVNDEVVALAKQTGKDMSYSAVFTNENTIFSSYGDDKQALATLETLLTKNKTNLSGGAIQSLVTDDAIFLLVPVLNAKDNAWLGTLGLTWSLSTIKEKIHSLIMGLMSVAIPVVLVVIAFLLPCMRYLVFRPISQINRLAAELAHGEGDLQRRIIYKRQDELQELCSNINQFIQKVQEALGEVTRQSAALTQIATESRRVSEDANLAAQSQRKNLASMSHSLTGMLASIKKVANNAANAESATNDAQQLSDEVKTTIDYNRTVIGTLASEVENAAMAIARLSDDSKQIGSIVDVIQNIADQTNLLALNAAIEAACAGSHGRGFSVVADEVRTLANKTQSSTKEIKAMIATLQSESQDAANIMVQGRDNARNSVEHAEQAREALIRITSEVEEISSVNTQIATATQVQSETAENLIMDIANLNKLSDSSADSAAQAARMGAELFDLIEKTQQTLARFKV